MSLSKREESGDSLVSAKLEIEDLWIRVSPVALYCP